MEDSIDCLVSAAQWSYNTALFVSCKPLWHVVAGNEAALEYKGHSDDEDDGGHDDDDDDFDDDDDDFDDDDDMDDDEQDDMDDDEQDDMDGDEA